MIFRTLGNVGKQGVVRKIGVRPGDALNCGSWWAACALITLSLLCEADESTQKTSAVSEREKIWYFGKVGVFDGPQVIGLQGA